MPRRPAPVASPAGSPAVRATVRAATWPVLLAALAGLAPTVPAVTDPAAPPEPTASAPAPAPSAPAAPPVPAADEPLTLKRIMADPEWIGHAPQRPWWSDDGRQIHYTRERTGSDLDDTFTVDLAGRIRQLTDAEIAGLSATVGDHDSQHRMKVFTRHGDLFLKEVVGGGERQITRTAARESGPMFLTDDQRVAFYRDGVLLVRDLITGLESQLVELEGGAEPEDEGDDEDDDSYLEDQQERLFEIIRRRDRRERESREQDEAREAADPTRAPEPWYLGRGKSAANQALSPRGDLLLVTLGPSNRDRGTSDHMPEWVTASGYVVDRRVRSLVGDGEESAHELALLDVVERSRLDVDLSGLPGMHVDPLADIKAETRRILAERKRAEADDGGDASADTDGSADADDPSPERLAEPRPVSIRNVEWSDDGRRVLFQAFSHDNKDRWTCVLDGDTHELVLVEHLHDPAWINWRFNEVGWMPDGETVWLTSERSGFSHLYVADVERVSPLAPDLVAHEPDDGDQHAAQATGTNGDRTGDDTPAVDRDHDREDEDEDDGIHLRQAELVPVTAGEFEVFSIHRSRFGFRFVVHARKEHPGVTEAYLVDCDGEFPSAPPAMQRLTHLGGQNTVTVSPDERNLLIRHSGLTSPPELYLQEFRAGAEAVRLTHTIEPAFEAVEWAVPEVVGIESTHGGGTLWSRVYAPADDAPGRGPDGLRPAVVFVHGAGYLQNAHLGWSTYFREFMFHSLLVERGYVVLDMDYRASAGYGRDHRTAIYRQMGTPELQDFRDGIDWIVAHRGVDRGRIGVYGGSYGGFMVLMALFVDPGLFACGAALRPVTDWVHYNHGYTSNILNEPEDDVVAYERSSPIEFAEGLERPLLLCHGMLDDNVFFKDTVRLAQRLIELEKDDWEVAVYPVEPHGFVEPSSWRDEYARILELFETHLR